MDAMNTITCRARVSAGCLNGFAVTAQFGEDLPLSEDGTYIPDSAGGTIVCDPCYIRLMPLTPSGMGLNKELDDAIATLREGASPAR